LHFCGIVGTGFTARHRRLLAEQLQTLHRGTSPFVGLLPSDVSSYARWTAPTLIGDVEYRDFRGSFRHPSWKGLRADLSEIAAVVLPA
jgi:bifunctional non-homologous end joining protein LigD